MAFDEKEVVRKRLKVALRQLYERTIELENAPEAIEFYDWRQVPYVESGFVTVREIDEPWRGALDVDPAPVAPRDTVDIPWGIYGNVTIRVGEGDVELPYKIGWDNYHRIAVISCGPA